ncbi:MAG: hypothetical protein KGJ80_19770 [Chloroflexota bacterium]|nr:hypothetical protein [Chloroflexota bacterium]
MKHRAIGFPLILFLFWVISCDLASLVSSATPAPDSIATRVAEAKAVAATLTVDASIARRTPLPTDTPRPTSTQTQTPTPTSVPSTPTPVPTPAIPKGWVVYTITNYTFSCPGEWRLFTPLTPGTISPGLLFHQKDARAERMIYVGAEEKRFQFGPSLDTDVNRFVEDRVRKSSAPTDILGKGLWNDGVHVGVYAETVERPANGSSNYWFQIALRVEDETVEIAWVRFSAETDTPRETLTTLSASIRLRR